MKRTWWLLILCTVAGIPACKAPATPTPEAPATWSLKIQVKSQRAVALDERRPRPDRISEITRSRTALLLDPATDPRARFGQMRVRLLDGQRSVIYTQFVEDVMSGAVEVPPGIDKAGNFDHAAAPPFWLTPHHAPTSALVAVPVDRRARWVEFTRYTPAGEEVEAGTLELEAGHAPPEGNGSSGAGPGVTPVEPVKATRRRAYNAADAEHETIIDNGSSGDLFDFLILADGYGDSNAARDRFRNDVGTALDHLWTIETYYELRSAMNVHVAFVPSVEEGAGTGPDDLKDTPFEAYFNCNDTLRVICLGNDGRDFAFTVAQDAPGNYGAGTLDAIAVLTGDDEYGGGGGTILTFSANSDSPRILAHEFGHTVIDLADEYESAYPALVEWSRTKVNITGDVAPADLKWLALVDPGTSIPTQVDPGTCSEDSTCSPSLLPEGTAGMYEGGGYVACGSFRPTTACLMRCFDEPLCPVCRKAYRDTLAALVPTVDIYMRDNSLDVGNAPSPYNVANPPGSSSFVKPWQSVDVVVDAPPFGDVNDPGPNENPMAGVTNRVFVTVHNRGSAPAPAQTWVELLYANATGGAPPFPGTDWTSLGTANAQVPGGEGKDTIYLDWDVPEGTPEHTCVLARADTAGDVAPEPNGSLSSWVRGSNNVTWKNLHVSDVPSLTGTISNFGEPREVLFRVETPDVPIGTLVRLKIEGTLVFEELEPEDPKQMTVESAVGSSFELRRDESDQMWFSLVTNLPGGTSNAPFEADFTLDLIPPGGTPVGTAFEVTVSQSEVDRASGLVGDLIAGNTYTLFLN